MLFNCNSFYYIETIVADSFWYGMHKLMFLSMNWCF